MEKAKGPDRATDATGKGENMDLTKDQFEALWVVYIETIRNLPTNIDQKTICFKVAEALLTAYTNMVLEDPVTVRIGATELTEEQEYRLRKVWRAAPGITEALFDVVYAYNTMLVESTKRQLLAQLTPPNKKPN